MGIRCHIENPEFRPKLEQLLDGLGEVYSMDTKSFLALWDKLPKPLFNVIASADPIPYRYDLELENLADLAEYCEEVFDWAASEKKKCEKQKPKAQKKKYKPFTLRNPEDLKQFEEFLDIMLELLDLSPGHFVTILPLCPLAFWDKIDDLRETSYKMQRDSTEFLRCLEKCKAISFAYSECSDINPQSNITGDE
jgi:hypothetical protein